MAFRPTCPLVSLQMDDSKQAFFVQLYLRHITQCLKHQIQLQNKKLSSGEKLTITFFLACLNSELNSCKYFFVNFKNSTDVSSVSMSLNPYKSCHAVVNFVPREEKTDNDLKILSVDCDRPAPYICQLSGTCNSIKISELLSSLEYLFILIESRL